MHIAICGLTTRTALMVWLLSHLSTVNSLHFITDLNMCTFYNIPGKKKKKKKKLHDVSYVVGTQ